MARILFLAHRIPYPPNKGDKIRSWNFLKHLCASHEIHAGFFIDDKDDAKHLGFLGKTCASVISVYASPFYQKLASLRGFLTGKSLTECAYPSRKMRTDIQRLIAANAIDFVFVYSAAPFSWLPQNMHGIPVVTDIVDVDSAKWGAYARKAKFPLNWIYKREAAYLEKFEMYVAKKSTATLFVSEDEATLFRRKFAANNVTANTISGIANGVDCEAFKPSAQPTDSTDQHSPGLIFTGAMDYAPNIEAVVWFTDNVLSLLKKSFGNVALTIAGGPVSPDVAALSKQGNVTVLGRVPDMAAVIDATDIVIAPLQTARGIQNKVLEGMAMAKPVIATSAANEGINAVDGETILIADTPEMYLEKIELLCCKPELAKTIGANARAYVKKEFSWPASFRLLDEIVEQALQPLHVTGRTE